MPKAIKKKSKNIKVLQLLYISTAFIWIILSKLSSYGRIAQGDADVMTIPIIMLVCALIYLLLAVATASLKRIYLYFGIAYTLLNILLTITDQIGIWDVLLLALYLLMLLFLFRFRKEFK